MSRDLITIAALLALCVVCMTVLTLAGQPIPVPLDSATIALVGAVAGAAVVNRKESRP